MALHRDRNNFHYHNDNRINKIFTISINLTYNLYKTLNFKPQTLEKPSLIHTN